MRGREVARMPLRKPTTIVRTFPDQLPTYRFMIRRESNHQGRS